MKKFLGVFLAVFLWAGVSFGVKAQETKKPCPCPNCPNKGQMMMSPEEWKKWHKDMPMPEEMKKHHEEMQKHREKMGKESENGTPEYHEEMEKKYHDKYHKKWH